jgi:hypothetical protein
MKEVWDAANDRHDARPRAHHVLAGAERRRGADDPAAIGHGAGAALGGLAGGPRRLSDGNIRVSETVNHGTRLRLSDLDVDVSEAVEAGVAFWLTPRDAVRATYLYYFLRGSATLDRSIAYDGQEYGAGAVDTNADFSRISLAYERLLTTVLDHGRLIGSAGLTYVLLNAGLTQHGKTKAADFYLQELPVPILGLRFDYPLTQRLGLRATRGSR